MNQLARAVIERTEQLADRVDAIAEKHPGKNPAAVALGRRGGLKGGRARMDSLMAEQRNGLAIKAAIVGLTSERELEIEKVTQAKAAANIKAKQMLLSQ